jgi:hypothetical protein
MMWRALTPSIAVDAFEQQLWRYGASFPLTPGGDSPRPNAPGRKVMGTDRHILCSPAWTLWKVCTAFALIGLMTGPATAVPGETLTLPIHHRDGSGWTEYARAGYGGTIAWSGCGVDGARRAYWELSGTGSLGSQPRG